MRKTGTITPQPTDQHAVLRAMEPADRWRVAASLYSASREWKAAGLRALHPDWSEQQILQSVRETFLRGHTA